MVQFPIVPEDGGRGAEQQDSVVGRNHTAADNATSGNAVRQRHRQYHQYAEELAGSQPSRRQGQVHKIRRGLDIRLQV